MQLARPRGAAVIAGGHNLIIADNDGAAANPAASGRSIPSRQCPNNNFPCQSGPMPFPPSLAAAFRRPALRIASFHRPKGPGGTGEQTPGKAATLGLLYPMALQTASIFPNLFTQEAKNDRISRYFLHRASFASLFPAQSAPSCRSPAVKTGQSPVSSLSLPADAPSGKNIWRMEQL